MQHRALEGSCKCKKCGKEFRWFYHDLIVFHGNPEDLTELSYYNGRNGYIQDFNRENELSSKNNAVLNVGEPREVINLDNLNEFCGFDIPLKCPNCGSDTGTKFIDLR